MICDGSALLKLEKNIIITIYMTINVRRDDDDVRQQCNDNEMMGTIWPAGRIQRRRHRSSRRIGVGVEGGQGGGVGRESWGSIAYTTHGRVRIMGIFLTMRCACLHA
jgi:hypothetical protein